jgi:hypothetical protein
VLVSTAAVQPHEPAALINRKGAFPTFRTTNVCETFDPWAIVPKLYSVSGKLICGLPVTESLLMVFEVSAGSTVSDGSIEDVANLTGGSSLRTIHVPTMVTTASRTLVVQIV